MSDAKRYTLKALAVLSNMDTGEVYQPGDEYEVTRTPAEIAELVRLGAVEVVAEEDAAEPQE